MIFSTYSAVVAKVAPPWINSCVANPSVVLPWPTKLQWIAGLGIQPPQIRSWTMNREQDHTRWLAEAKKWPILIVQGTEDSHCSDEVLVRQARQVFEDVNVHMMDGFGHSPHFERPPETNQLILAFIKKSLSDKGCLRKEKLVSELNMN
ncbi:hypothetical protein AcW1_008092 [Taiwanofungus camphoratus]|nr:hypothetical protein AcV5_008391 [Antrodia cinnamomea]KAI0950911.1 hypothetical protein AcW1_008092 [Antrodia cinnamomea]